MSDHTNEDAPSPMLRGCHLGGVLTSDIGHSSSLPSSMDSSWVPVKRYLSNSSDCILMLLLPDALLIFIA